MVDQELEQPCAGKEQVVLEPQLGDVVVQELEQPCAGMEQVALEPQLGGVVDRGLEQPCAGMEQVVLEPQLGGVVDLELVLPCAGKEQVVLEPLLGSEVAQLVLQLEEVEALVLEPRQIDLGKELQSVGLEEDRVGQMQVERLLLLLVHPVEEAEHFEPRQASLRRGM